MRFRTGVVLLLLIRALPCSAADDVPKGVTFHAGFDGSLKATSGAAPRRAPKAVSFVPGVRGKAVLIGDDASAFEYAGWKNVPAAGTVAFWLKAPMVDAGGREVQPRPLLAVRDGRNGLLLLKASTGSHNTWNFFGTTRARQFFRPHADVVNGAWHHIAVTWNAARLSVYSDGDLSMAFDNERAVTFRFSKSRPGKIFLGPWRDGGTAVGGHGRRDAAIDELFFLARVLSAEEVLALFNRDAKIKKVSRAAEYIRPTLAAPRMARPPVIDGAIGEQEWAESMPIVKLIDGTAPAESLSYPPSRIHVGRDAKALYLAARTYFPEGRK